MPPNSRIKATTKFSLADIVQGAQVQEATLSVFHIADETGRSPTDGVFGLDDVRWKEETVSFDNPPGGSYGATDTPKLDDSTYTDGVAGRVNFDVTDYVQQKLDAGADSITFKQVQDPGTQSGNTDFASKENANGNAPQLIITGMPIPVEVAPEGLSSGVYFVRLEARERTATEQITLVR